MISNLRNVTHTAYYALLQMDVNDT
ncbi:uncharacterized protein METZ01_LOCUS441894, partial [marine metagenome]